MKASAKPAATNKKATITEISDEDEAIQMSDDLDFEVVAPPEKENKGSGKPPAAKPSQGSSKGKTCTCREE
ncbi:hypothetical protein CTI12_AA286790 [Artemisia annua]|uniref:Uncharacterized protein n=1 Tax=Artemisia annua TaxID=35608 RepID=A0A2U1NB87_ARTAN|nr:hypothetical protein CTI12_AA286790 [Artemisia annua]